ncbi:thermonuclease family protein [Tsuneonella troitsensis]|uniref:thermonuclease family protein n=1 Tax=Tsuneonella troitsensis TaxID=292222 RepID=UPI00070CDBE0|nr:thermonuclease family protein [Tsuneonella troitsensis]
MIIAPDQPEAASEDEVFQAVVTKVFDGDGFLAKLWNPYAHVWIERVPFRFAFIDAPEMEQPGGPEARDVLAGLILGKSLRLDPIGKESTGYKPIDPYRRVLCMGYFTDELAPGRVDYFLQGVCGSGTAKKARLVTRNIELEMIVNGWAWVVQQYAFERETEYFEAQESARRARRGLWATNNPEAPWKFKARQRRRSNASSSQTPLL